MNIGYQKKFRPIHCRQQSVFFRATVSHKTILDSDRRMEGLTTCSLTTFRTSMQLSQEEPSLASFRFQNFPTKRYRPIANLALQRRQWLLTLMDYNNLSKDGSRGRRMKVPENASLLRSTCGPLGSGKAGQDDLATDDSNVTKQYVSKVEAGHIAIPHHNFSASIQCTMPCRHQ